MNRPILIVFYLLLASFMIYAEADSPAYRDNISRLELLGFHYFPQPQPLIPGRLISPSGESVTVNGSSRQIILIIFLSGGDPFENDLKEDLAELSRHYAGDPFKIITVSPAEEDYKDRESRSADRWGVINYPTILLADHNFLLRGSSEGIYPDLASEGFFKVIDRLLLDIKSPGIINTLQ